MTIFRADLLKGKRILVTGGGTGLGREVAGEYAKLGAEVYICGRRGAVVAETARELAETHNTRVTPIECDIRSPDAVESMMTRVFGAGGGSFWQLSRLGDQDWENIRSTIKSANEKDKAARTA